MNQEGQPDSSGLVSALADRLNSEVQRIGVTARLALAETSLAASSAGLLLLFVLLSAALLFVCWLLLMALAWQGLLALGLSTVTALTVLLGVHLFAVCALLLASWRLSRNMAFTQTRKALANVHTSTNEANGQM